MGTLFRRRQCLCIQVIRLQVAKQRNMNDMSVENNSSLGVRSAPSCICISEETFSELLSRPVQIDARQLYPEDRTICDPAINLPFLDE